MIIDIHMLKSFPPTNLNRDDSGSPKTCVFGGCQRGRISSQSLKHAWRRDSEFQKLPLGIRTRKLPDIVSKQLLEQGVDEKLVQCVKPKLSAFGNKKYEEQDDQKTAQIMFFAPEDVRAVTEAVKQTILENPSPEKLKEISAKQWMEQLKNKARPISLDMALFGRMITDDSFANVEAAMQVAHAISTHVVNMESDFFTAVDDLMDKEIQETGSAMMGDTDFNSCCYYLYISLDVEQLMKNAEGSPEVLQAIPRVLPLLLEAIAYTNPSGKQNSFAGHSMPGVMCVEKKPRNVPVSYANAYEKPVYSRSGYMEPSAKRLSELIDLYDQSYGLPVDERLWLAPGLECQPQKATRMNGLPDMMGATEQWLRKG